MSREGAMNIATGTPIVTEVPNPPPQIPSLDSERFAKLAAKETAIIKEREALKAEKLKDEETRKQLQSYKQTIDEFEELKKTDKIAALKKIGFTEEDIFNFLSGKEEPKEPTPAEIAAQAAREEIEKDRKAQAELRTKEESERNDKAIKAYKSSITDVIKKDAEKYEYCTHYGPVAEEIIYETILGFMAEDAELTPVDAMKEAIEAVEKMYEEEDKAMSSLKKRQPKPVETKKEEPLRPEVNSRSTLRRPDPTPVAGRKESKEEKRERLINKLRG